MRSRFGYLYLAEQEVKDELKALMGQIKSNAQWAETVAGQVAPGATPAVLAEKAKAYRTVLADIQRKIKGANISNLRYWRDALRGISNIASGVAVAPPTPAPVVAPTPTPAPAAEEAMPPAPPGVSCPHYSQASAFPPNWNDPAAEQRYLNKYEDVKNWTKVMQERFKGKGLNALWHYRCYGKDEGRTWAGLGFYGSMPGYLR